MNKKLLHLDPSPEMIIEELRGGRNTIIFERPDNEAAKTPAELPGVSIIGSASQLKESNRAFLDGFYKSIIPVFDRMRQNNDLSAMSNSDLLTLLTPRYELYAALKDLGYGGFIERNAVEVILGHAPQVDMETAYSAGTMYLESFLKNNTALLMQEAKDRHLNILKSGITWPLR